MYYIKKILMLNNCAKRLLLPVIAIGQAYARRLRPMPSISTA
jgi:hypothetical protein